MSPRRLAGWEPSTRVEYVRDGDRVVGAVVSREPEWCQRDVDMLLAEAEWERSLDPNGFPLDEATAPAADPNDRSGAYMFKAGLPVVNYAEKARRDAEDAYRSEYPDASMNGLIFPVEKIQRG